MLDAGSKSQDNISCLPMHVLFFFTSTSTLANTTITMEPTYWEKGGLKGVQKYSCDIKGAGAFKTVSKKYQNAQCMYKSNRLITEILTVGKKHTFTANRRNNEKLHMTNHFHTWKKSLFKNCKMSNNVQE